MTSREEMYELVGEYRQAIRDFLASGEIDNLFSFVQRNPVLVKSSYISAHAKDMLRNALRHQQADADAYRAIVKLSMDAGVPLFPTPPKV